MLSQAFAPCPHSTQSIRRAIALKNRAASSAFADRAPCIRHRVRPFTAGDWHSVPLRVLAKQRRARPIAVSAMIVLNAPVNGPQHHSWALGYLHCLALVQAASGLSEGMAWVASARTLLIAVVSALPDQCSCQPMPLTIPQRPTETDQCPA